MEIRELRSLLRLADHGGIVKTAGALNLTSPAIHKHLKPNRWQAALDAGGGTL